MTAGENRFSVVDKNVFFRNGVANRIFLLKTYLSNNVRSMNILPIAIWGYFLTDSYVIGLELPFYQFIQRAEIFEYQVGIYFLFMNFIYFSTAYASQNGKQSKLYKEVSGYLERKYSPGVSERFIKKIQPELLMACELFVFGFVAIFANFYSNQVQGAYVLAFTAILSGVSVLAVLTKLKYVNKKH